jgi:hypothetical protein
VSVLTLRRLIELDLGQTEVLQQSDVAIIRMACRQVAALASEIASVRRRPLISLLSELNVLLHLYASLSHWSPSLLMSMRELRGTAPGSQPLVDRVLSPTPHLRRTPPSAARSCSRSSRPWTRWRPASVACSRARAPPSPPSWPSPPTRQCPGPPASPSGAASAGTCRSRTSWALPRCVRVLH